MMAGRDDLGVWRCPGCTRILAKLRLSPGSVVEVKCHSCGALITRETPAADESATLAPVIRP
jgi:hypothetical protein